MRVPENGDWLGMGWREGVRACPRFPLFSRPTKWRFAPHALAIYFMRGESTWKWGLGKLGYETGDPHPCFAGVDSPRLRRGCRKTGTGSAKTRDWLHFGGLEVKWLPVPVVFAGRHKKCMKGNFRGPPVPAYPIILV